MPNFILTRSSVILCPHGGFVMHVPMSPSFELINGEVPLLVDDRYLVAGCSFMSPSGMDPCLHVFWTNPSVTKRIGGVPVLTNASIGILQSAFGISPGLAIIATFQTRETD